MKNKVFTIICLVLLVAACITSYVAKVDAIEYAAIGVAFLAATALAIKTYKKSEKKPINLVTIILFGVAGVLAAIAGMPEDTFTKVVTYVVAGIALIASIITGVVAIKKVESK